LTATNCEYALRIPTHSNLMNPPAIGTDRRGRPYISSYWSPAADAAPQFNIVQHTGSEWRIIPGPTPSQSFTLAGTGTKRPPLSRAALLVDQTWDRLALHLIYRDDARGGRIVLATRAGYEPGEWRLRELNDTDVGGWEPSFDPVSWQRLTQGQLLVQNVTQRDGDDRTTATGSAKPISHLIWAPVTDRMRASSSHARTAAAHDATTTVAASPADNAPRDAAAILALAQRATDWQWANFPPAEKRHPRGWEVAPFYIGVLALDRVSPNHRNRERMLQQADALGWQPHQRIYHADDHCVIQAYLELHDHYREPRMIAPSKERFDHILANPTTALFDWGTPNCGDHWSWCDALFMAPVAWLQLWKETGDKRYLDFMNENWWLTTKRLYLPEVGFYLRDESYLDLREPNGKTIHWSRGNGWVFAGLARVLDLFPQDHADYPRYVKLYRDMAKAVLAAQQSDGLWRVGLLDPDTHTVRETSGTAFFTYGLAWGLNRGLLDAADAKPAVQRGWQALASSVTADGKLENVQPIGHSPEGFDPHHTDVFAVGAFLLAATEVSQLK
jgi:rhamnogalacturonyl hydrolase YesR